MKPTQKEFIVNRAEMVQLEGANLGRSVRGKLCMLIGDLGMRGRGIAPKKFSILEYLKSYFRRLFFLETLSVA